MVEGHKVWDTFARVLRAFSTSCAQNIMQESDVLESFLDRFYEHISLPVQKERYSFYTKKKLAFIDILKKVKNKGLIGSIKKVLFG